MKRTVLSFVLFTACADSSGRSAAQLVEIETTIQNGSSTSIERTSMTYEGSHLKDITRQHNGAAAGSARFTYGAGGIERIEYTDDEGDRASEQLSYEGGRLVRGRYEIAGIRVDERSIAYGESGAIKEVSTLSTSPGANGTTTLTRYEYDGSGRVAKLLELAGSQTASTELRYAIDGTLERATQFEGGDLRETFTFELDGEGRLSEVSDSRNGRYEVTYDDASLVSEIRRSTASGTTTTQYRYGSGSVDGWTFAPAVPVAQLFDLTGAAYATVSPLHGDIELPRDLPRASGGGDEPGPTCGFDPVTACDSCVEASCCSEAGACLAGSACDSFVACAEPCTTQACIDVCSETNPAGRSDYESLVNCVQVYCPTSCGT